MENASKALIMAAGVLVGILILSLAVYLFVTFGTEAGKVRDRITEQQLAEYNSKFMIYADREDITLYDIITVAGLAVECNENNKGYTDFDENYKVKIRVELNGQSPLEVATTTTLKKLKKKLTEEGTYREVVWDDNKMKFSKLFKSAPLTLNGSYYYKNGRVKGMIFKEQ